MRRENRRRKMRGRTMERKNRESNRRGGKKEVEF